MSPNISIIVCCYNSAKRLPQTLKFLASQELNDLRCELIIVDNNSSDKTSEVATRLWNNYGNPYPLKIIIESKPGLSNARKKGIKSANSEVLLFCDDDNWLEFNYVQLAYEIMASDNNLMILGGIGEPVFESEKPIWFDTYQANYAVGNQIVKNIGNKNFQIIYGAGFVLKMEFLRKIDSLGFKSLLVGRKGKELTSGEDTEYCLIACLLGYKLKVDNRLRFRHFIPANRLNFNYLKRWHYGYGKTRIYLDIYYHFFKKDDLPQMNLRFPFWFHIIFYRCKKIIRYYPKIWLIKKSSKNFDFILSYNQLLGEISELWKIKNAYSSSFHLVRNIIIKNKKIKI